MAVVTAAAEEGEMRAEARGLWGGRQLLDIDLGVFHGRIGDNIVRSISIQGYRK